MICCGGGDGGGGGGGDGGDGEMVMVVCFPLIRTLFSLRRLASSSKLKVLVIAGCEDWLTLVLLVAVTAHVTSGSEGRARFLWSGRSLAYISA